MSYGGLCFKDVLKFILFIERIKNSIHPDNEVGKLND